MSKVALIWGANGVSGTAMVNELTKQPNTEWASIIAVSRREMQTDNKDTRLHFVAVDVLKSTEEELVQKLRAVGGAHVTHAFHYTYIEKSTEDELVEVNRALLDKALRATAGASQKVKFFHLQTGYKYYGVMKAELVASTPFTEETPRHPGKNFYYNQEDLLQSFCKEHGWAWCVTRPNFIIGVAKGNFMNLAVSLGLYATIQKHLKQPFIFPGNQITWSGRYDYSWASNNARFQLFSSTHEKCYNQAFNIKDRDEPYLTQEIWEKLASYFNLQVPANQFEGMGNDKRHVPQLKMAEYMQDKQQVWREIVKGHGLDEDTFKYATWSFVDFAFSRTTEDIGSLAKARKAGWDVSVDSVEGFYETWNEMKRLKMLPPM